MISTKGAPFLIAACILALMRTAEADCYLLSSRDTPFLDWSICADKAADLLDDRRESAGIVADAALLKCFPEQQAYDVAIGGPGCLENTFLMKKTVRKLTIEHILTERARRRLLHEPTHPATRRRLPLEQ